ncbi:hypothetical protein RHMOL_Rhmol02G0318200 [Rhododendron molle]|uniref:Uncharacterized protein n=1 Tax=Rhododendron molle TaxID=49168 RepID=A0ACC0PYV1_RHOML|nr:hypothetical protein RHMOL_Rhmol02G0318200 [Rhododendron molle]
MQQTVLTLWDQFVQHEGRAFTQLSGAYPIVLGVRFKVDTRNGVKLQTRGSTTFIFDPVLPEANALKSWCMIHSAAINKLPAIELQQVGLIKSLIPCRSQIIKINRLPTIVSTKVENHQYVSDTNPTAPLIFPLWSWFKITIPQGKSQCWLLKDIHIADGGKCLVIL